MRMSFGMIVFNGDPVLRENLETVYPYAHEIVITEGPVKFYRDLGYTQSTDDTVRIIEEFPDPEGKITLTRGQWEEKDEMCNAYARYLSGDFVWHLDADEIYQPRDIERVFGYLESHPDCYSMSFRLYSFYGGLDHYVSGFEENFEVHRIQRIIGGQSRWVTHRPPTMLWPPTGKTCKEMGHVGHMETDRWGVRIYHYSYLMPKQVKAKVAYYTAWSSIIPDYWNQVYVPWMRAKDDAGRRSVESRYIGVQEWLPERRGPSFTKRFPGTHPEAVEKARPRLTARMSLERAELGV